MEYQPIAPGKPGRPFKNRAFRERLGFAAAGVRTVFRRERSLRAQCGLALAAAILVASLQPNLLWAAITALCIGLVLALETVNAAIEYLIDHLHPEIAEEIKHAKDAAAGAVLIASGTAVCIGTFLLLAWAAPG